MIFNNPAGAPELACDQCGCRRFDRMANTCYQCGAEVTAQNRADIEAALRAFAAGKTAMALKDESNPGAF
jgi:uncharacterized protein (DUF983 family)